MSASSDRLPSLESDHSIIRDSVFRFKVAALIIRRVFLNRLSPRRKYVDAGELAQKEVVAFSETKLWNDSDTEENRILTAGKIENLRIAARKIHGIEVKANEVFSFWKHVGNPTRLRGYVIGREIREGCIVPSVGGGLCQLSNALYDAALKAGFTIVERHKHTRVIPGSLAEKDRDATIKWNYLDLQFTSSFNFRIDVELTAEMLVVSFRSDGKQRPSLSPAPPLFPLFNADKLNDCYSCGNELCYKHQGSTGERCTSNRTTYVLDEMWDEYDRYVIRHAENDDIIIVPFKRNNFLSTNRYRWTTDRFTDIRSLPKQAVGRALRLRFGAKQGKNLFELGIKLDTKLAKKAVSQIPIGSTHLVIAQNLLPHLFATGALGGRTYDVLMTRLPMERLHEALDTASKFHPDNKLLRDFRAPQHLINLENKALTRARKIITPHTAIAKIFENKVEKLDWIAPPASHTVSRGNKILFPASAIPRKGALEMRRLSKELGVPLLTMGPVSRNPGFWEGAEVCEFDGRFENVGLVIYPAFIEHHPLMLLKSISKGIRVITTDASGIEASELVTVISPGDYDQLRNAVQQFLSASE